MSKPLLPGHFRAYIDDPDGRINWCCGNPNCDGHLVYGEPSTVLAHVEQHHLDESGSKWRLMYVAISTKGLKLNARGQYILPLGK